MTTKQIDRLIFTQGGNCFFCAKPLPKEHASVEHLVATTLGGKDGDENCVACCKTLNNLFGRISLKEKFKIILNQSGNFICPGNIHTNLSDRILQETPSPQILPVKEQQKNATQPPKVKKPTTVVKTITTEEKVKIAVEIIRRHENKKPTTVKSLENTLRSQIVHQGIAANDAPILISELAARAYVIIKDTSVAYKLPKKA